MKQDFPEQIRVKIFYDEALKEITGKDFEEARVCENLTFVNFLYFVFSSYPEIKKQFGPGTLGFSVNGKAPSDNEILREGDVVRFIATPIGDTRRAIETKLSEIIRDYHITTTVETIKELILNEKRGEDFNEIVEIFTNNIDNRDEANQALEIVNAAWNFFPHKSLGGLAPIEKLKSINPTKNKANRPILDKALKMKT